MPQGQSRSTLIIGLALIGLGVLFLLQQLFDLRIWDWLWPLVIMAFGGMFFAGMAAGSRGAGAGALAIPGSIITGIGLMMFVMNLTGRWEAWAYAWGLIVAFVGVGLAINGWWSGQPGLRRSGWALARTGLFLFLVFGAFFELLIFGSVEAGNWLWPVILIGLGLWLLVRRSGLVDGLFGWQPARDETPAAEVTVEGAARRVAGDE
jgi:hypothetical protein